MTGGAAGTLTVSYQGKSLPRLLHRLPRRVQRQPEKYAKLADAALAKAPSTAKPAVRGKDDGSFDGLIDEPKAAPTPSTSEGRPEEQARRLGRRARRA